jgi:CDP-6-deoxy-D-xylo-4-hexulose-3-dehydrase
MTMKEKIQGLVGNHVPPYLYGSNFIPGETLIPYSGMYWDDKESEAAITAFLNGSWITAGENVYDFEGKFSLMFNVKHSLMVNSGSSANLVMITGLKKYFNWQDGDEVIVSPVGFPTTVSVLYQNRLTPVFVDIEWDTLNFCLCGIEKKITKKTKAIFLSPVLGNPPDMDELLTICSRYDLKLILDNCDSLGSKWDNKYLNEYAVASSCSFYPAHHISTGEGGMICTDDDELNKLFTSIAWWGRDCHCVGVCNMLKDGSCGRRFDKWLPLYDGVVDHKYVFSNMGYNLKPLDLQGAIGLEQLKKFNYISERRKTSKRVIHSIVTSHLPNVKGVYKFDKADTNWFGVPFVCKEDGLKHRLVQHLEENKIQTRNYFSGNILLHPGYSFLDDYKKYPEANKVLDKVFFLGCAPHYGNQVFVYIEDVIRKFYT